MEVVRLKRLLEVHVKEFKNWLSANYTDQQINNEQYDDTGYPHWDSIEGTFELVFKYLDFEALEPKMMQNIGYLIARQWDVGIIFPYFRKEISQLGMTQIQLLQLAEYALYTTEWSLKQQCAASLWKATDNKKTAAQLIMKFLEDDDEDIRRHAAYSLEKLLRP